MCFSFSLATPSCCIATVRAAISPSLKANLFGDSFTLVVLRPCSVSALRAALYLPPFPGCLCRLSSLCVRGMSTLGRAPRNQCCGPVLPAFSRACAAPLTSPFIALPIDPLAVRAQDLLPHYSLVCGSVLLTQNSSNEIVNFSCFSKLQTLFEFLVSVEPLGNFRLQ